MKKTFLVMSILVVFCGASLASNWLNTTADNLWTTAGNWDSPPNPLVSTTIDKSGVDKCILDAAAGTIEVVIGGTAAGELVLTTGADLDLNKSFIVGHSTTGSLLLLEGNANVYTGRDSGFLKVGNNAGTSGRVELRDSSIFDQGKRANIGQSGHGELAIYDSAQYVSPGVMYIANKTGASGLLEMYGSSYLQLGLALHVGVGAGTTGHFEMAGGIADIQNIFIGDGGGAGTVDMTGTATINIIAADWITVQTDPAAEWAALKARIEGYKTAGILATSEAGKMVGISWNDAGYSGVISVVPEPATMLILGLGGVLIRRRK